MGQNRVFFPQAALDEWVAESRVEFRGEELLIKSEGRYYRLVEAARVLAEVTGQDDLYGLVGRVKSLSYLRELGADVYGESMVISDSAYECVPGFLGTPSEQRPGARDASTPSAEASLLAQYLIDTLD